MVRKTIANSLTLAALGSAVVTVVGFALSERMLALLNVPLEIRPMALSYLKVHFLGTLFMTGYIFVSAILQGLGDSKTPVKFLALAVVLNLVLDPFFIVGIGPLPPLGVAGAAIATVISHAVSFILAIWYLGRDGKLLDLWFQAKADKELTRKTLVVGLPSGVQQTIVSLGIMAMSSIVNSFGTAVVAAFGAASRLDQFAMMPAQSLALATSTVAGQNIGARKYGRVKQVLIWACLIAASIALAVTGIAQFTPRILMRLLHPTKRCLG